MAKISTDAINGFDAMTAEQKVQALLGVDIPEVGDAKLKEALTKANSEAADWKKKYTATLDDATKKEQEREEALKTLQTENEALKRDKTVNAYKAKLIAVGYSEQSADAAAKAFADGDGEAVIKTISELKDSVIKETKAGAVNTGFREPGNPGGKESGAQAKDISRMSYEELAQMKEKDPESFRKLIG